ncbi:Carbohydrate kinase PfkB domain-containing protein [Strongyloides ratti]|uniref:Carbohydrate kinase PfkB domain-containing protein n=1 Tax=Strongyloides ratti TaxID=34506 RepID=A0A090LQQ5_STRRB|nr:Carbohydrate kinase PfkB domain-containing protein [Strongyloides ratti]CEF70511.1 Carbohydrate kinase PfkB domain-containing protein [Strongyloides ratti]
MKLCLITLDKDGVIVWDNSEKKSYEYDAPKNCNIISPSGAGDCFNSGFIASLIHNKSISESLAIATNCAKQSIESEKAVPDKFNVLK